jgi:hypothetical protein
MTEMTGVISAVEPSKNLEGGQFPPSGQNEGAKGFHMMNG